MFAVQIWTMSRIARVTWINVHILFAKLSVIYNKLQIVFTKILHFIIPVSPAPLELFFPVRWGSGWFGPVFVSQWLCERLEFSVKTKKRRRDITWAYSSSISQKSFLNLMERRNNVETYWGFLFSQLNSRRLLRAARFAAPERAVDICAPVSLN